MLKIQANSFPGALRNLIRSPRSRSITKTALPRWTKYSLGNRLLMSRRSPLGGPHRQSQSLPRSRFWHFFCPYGTWLAANIHGAERNAMSQRVQFLPENCPDTTDKLPARSMSDRHRSFVCDSFSVEVAEVPATLRMGRGVASTWQPRDQG